MTTRKKTPAKVKPVKGWAMVSYGTDQIRPWLVGRTRRDALDKLFNWVGQDGWEYMKVRPNFRCIRVLITPTK